MLQKLKQLNKAKKIMAMLGFVCIIAGSMHLAYADNSSVSVSSGLAFAAVVTAALVWSFSGYISNWRSHKIGRAHV